jgi:general secretion pathway protein I
VTPRPSSRPDRGFTLVEVLVALVVVALGLAALMVAVQGAARTSGYLRDKTLAQWIALNRLAEVRLTVNKLAAQTSAQASAAQNNDTGQLDFASRTWHYDTRYFDTTFPGMKRVVVRVWAGDAKTKGNPITETTSFLGTSLGQPGLSNTDWTVGSTASTALCGPQTAGGAGVGAAVAPTTGGVNGAGVTGAGVTGAGVNCTPAAGAGVPGVAPTVTPQVGVGTGQSTPQ